MMQRKLEKEASGSASVMHEPELSEAEAEPD